MDSCPRCGTLNRKGSNYCSHCGQQLDAFSVVQCPICSAPNPAGNPSCAFCGTPLAHPTESDRIHPHSAPHSQPGSTESMPAGPKVEAASPAELPPWLYQQPDAKPGAYVPSATAGTAAGSEADHEPSKYLHGLRGVLKDEEGWLASSLGKHLAERAKS
jgi:hypothetical protein